MNARALKIWFLVCGCHAVLALVLPLIRDSWGIGTLVIYLTVLLLSDTGLPGLVIAADTCGWESPTKLGWTAGIITWLFLYFLLACLIERSLKPKRRTM